MLLFKLAEEVVAFVVDQHEGGQTFDFHHPDRFHSQFGVFEAAQAFHILLRQQGRCAADTAEVKAAIFVAGLRHLLAAVAF